MHNRAFADRGLNACYLAFQVNDIEAAVAAIRALGIQGASITLPHKTAVMPLLDEVDPEAAAIGAVNTIVNRNGTLVGKNSDSAGAMDALGTQSSIAGKTALIVGAGGAARAIGFGLHNQGSRITITNRSIPAGEALAGDLGGSFAPTDELAAVEFDLLINTTPVGMHPQTDASPVPLDILRPELTVMDIIYNPLETRLLQAAARKGCKTVDGLAMFVNQGARQFEWWTGEQAPAEIMRQAVLEKLS
jgi:shikimate dehydrogenase